MEKNLGHQYKEDYYINSNISNYQDYTKKKYGGLCEQLITQFNLNKEHKILDFGCALGNLVKEFVDRGYNIKGTDISNWAINYGKNNGLGDYLEYYNPELLSKDNDYILLLDVLEHIEDQFINTILEIAKGKIILRLPVSKENNGPYVLEVSENDKTHIQRKTKETRIKMFENHNYKVTLILGEYIYDSEGVLAVLLVKNK